MSDMADTGTTPPDEQRLVFNSDRSGDMDLWEAVWNGATLGAPVSLDALNSAGSDEGATLTRDGLTIFFASNRPGGNGNLDLWVATRPSIDSEFSAPINLGGVNGSLRGQVVPELAPTPPVAMDPEQMQKVVLNLLLNANDAVREGGRIGVKTGAADEWVYVAVTDDGCGMSRDFIARSLFKPFRTTKGQGLGIGLFHSKSIVEAHRGRIEVESEEGKGTTFRVLLPGGTA